MRKKCPYLSTYLECFAGSFGTVKCLDHKFHSKCRFKSVVHSKPIREDTEEIIPVNF